MEGPGIGIRGLRFAYRRRAPLFDGMNLDLHSGKTVILGPNGAGKTTLLELLSGGLAPTAGQIKVDGSPCSSGRLRRLVSVMPQRIRTLSGLNAVEQVTYSAWLAGLRPAEAADAAVVALEAVGLSGLATRRPGKMSGGERRRLGLAAVLATRNQHILLDEPTAGLDPEQRYNFRRLMADVSPKICMVVSTHDIGDVEELYDHVVIISNGSVRFSGPTEEFMRFSPRHGSDRSEAAYLDLISEARS